MIEGHDEKNIPGKIADMPEWHFWARDLIGATDEDRENFKNGKLTPERLQALTLLGTKAREELAERDVPGFSWWMQDSPRRMN